MFFFLFCKFVDSGVGKAVFRALFWGWDPLVAPGPANFGAVFTVASEVLGLGLVWSSYWCNFNVFVF